jgi:DNA-binding transcriptional regulator GbsR (MarR family)
MSMLKSTGFEPNRELLWMYIERIVDEIFPRETGASRLQQVGLFTLIYVMQRQPPVTAARIAEVTRQSQSQIHRQMKKLIRLKLIKRTKILNKQGRGHAFKLEINYTAKAKRLLNAIRKATAGS